MCLSCVSPLQSVMVYRCSTDVTNKDYPCAAVRVPVLPFPSSPGVVKTLRVASKGCSVRASARPVSSAEGLSVAEIRYYWGSWQWPTPGISEEGDAPCLCFQRATYSKCEALDSS